MLRAAFATLLLSADPGCLQAEPLYPRAPGATDTPDARTAYDRAVQVWKTPEDINAWIAARFSYDTDRAIQLSATQRARHGTMAIHEPWAFFETGSGVCVDLARFAVETLRRVAPQSEPRYLMLELEPAQIRGNTLRLHWLASFRRDGKLYFFADSKRPGHIAGPYDDAQAFVASYAYDGRKVIAFREVETYEKTRRSRAAMRHRAPAEP
jgi:hypothetical protein